MLKAHWSGYEIDSSEAAYEVGSLGFRRVTVSESPTCWGRGATNPNKLGTPVRYPRQLPKTHEVKVKEPEEEE